MSPQSLHYSSPASGDVAGTGGRHRRPESLADSRPRVSYDLPGAAERPTRSARHRPAPAGGDTAGRRTPASGWDTAGRRPTRSARHAAAHRPEAEKRPITGSHRAPGTLPIESWLLMGKKRQQVLLAALVAAGLLLIAIPGTRGPSGIDAINAASEGKAGKHTAQKTKPADKGAEPAPRGNDSDPQAAERGKATPAPSAPSAPATGAAQQHPAERGSGPGASLRVTGGPTVALTFDDGPDPQQTPRILALLDQYQVKATFCLVGQQVQKHPEIVRQIAAAGHTLCNHTWSHSLTIGKDKPEQIQADLARTNAAIQAAVPGAPIPFFRAPGGNFTDRLVGVAAATGGMTSLYWEVDPQDWKHEEGESDAAHTARVVADVKKHVRPGSIVLSHDFNQPDTIAAYQKLLPWLKENFTLGIPGRPTAAPSTPVTTAPTPTDPPATPAPAGSTAPAAGGGAGAPVAGTD